MFWKPMTRKPKTPKITKKFPKIRNFQEKIYEIQKNSALQDFLDFPRTGPKTPWNEGLQYTNQFLDDGNGRKW